MSEIMQCCVHPPSCVCCTFAITVHGVRIGMEHLKQPETLLLSAATNKAAGKCPGISLKLRAYSIKRRKDSTCHPASCALKAKDVWIFFQICLDFRGRSG